MLQGPWYLFDPESPGYLEHKLDRNEPIAKADLIRVFEANPGFSFEGRLHALYVQLLSGAFKEKPGPKAGRSWSEWQIINVLVDIVREEVRHERAAPGYKKSRADRSPMEEACERVARIKKLGGGRALQNALSSRKLRGN